MPSSFTLNTQTEMASVEIQILISLFYANNELFLRNQSEIVLNNWKLLTKGNTYDVLMTSFKLFNLNIDFTLKMNPEVVCCFYNIHMKKPYTIYMLESHLLFFFCRVPHFPVSVAPFINSMRIHIFIPSEHIAFMFRFLFICILISGESYLFHHIFLFYLQIQWWLHCPGFNKI